MSQQIRQFISKNPYNNKINREYPFIANQLLQQKIELGYKSFQDNKNNNFKIRSQKISNLGSEVEKNANFYAEIITQEMGKPIAQSKAEVLKSANHCKFYAENLERFLKNDRIKTEATKSGIMYQPLGQIYLMIPFNFPFWLTFKSAIPILASGNSILLRNSDSTPILGDELEKLFKNQFDNSFQNVYTKPQQFEDIVSSNYIQGVSFTGSTQAGKAIASTSGKYLKKCVLELGGSDPFIVCLDADLDLAAEMAVKSRLFNNGQVCISAKRFIINKNVVEIFKEKLIENIEKQVHGDPMNSQTTVGPLARHDLKENIIKQVNQAKEQGAQLIYEKDHDKTDNNDNFYGPVVLQIDNKENVLFSEEIFGPVFSILPVSNDNEAIKIANSSDFGLGAAIFSKDKKNAEEIGKQLDCGMVFINDMVKTDSRLPSGGCKQSGYGRECGEVGIKEFTNIKTYYVA